MAYARIALRADDVDAMVAYGWAMTVGEREQTHGSRALTGVDIGLVVGMGLAIALTISVAQEKDATRAPDALAYALGVTIAALLIARRCWPIGVLVASMVVLLAYHHFGFPGFTSAVALAAASYSAAAAGQLVPAAALLTVFTGAGVAWQTLAEDVALLTVLGQNTIVDAALLAAVLSMGAAARHRRAWAVEVQARLRRAEQDRARQAVRRTEEERLRIARELHDVIAHTIAAVNVQAGVAADVIDDSPDQARAALRTIREQTREAIKELHGTVSLLRGGTPNGPPAPAPGLAGLDALVRFAGEGGLEVECSLAGQLRPLPPVIELTAYRIVQESLTNVVRHAHASRASVLVRFEPAALVVRIEDDGRGANGMTPGDGHGLMGMRERAAAVGGSVEAGTGHNGGFVVCAHLPIGGRG
jgi:signal transduction histidine kinase